MSDSVYYIKIWANLSSTVHDKDKRSWFVYRILYFNSISLFELNDMLFVILEF